jgi:hypothetical protein
MPQQLTCPDCGSFKTFCYDHVANCAECAETWESPGSEDCDPVVDSDAWGNLTASQVYAEKAHCVYLAYVCNH